MSRPAWIAPLAAAGLAVAAALPLAASLLAGPARPTPVSRPVAAVPDEADDPDLVDRLERLVVVDADGSLPPVHLETLRAFVRAMPAEGATLQATLCAASDDAGAWRLARALSRAFAQAGVPAWSIRAQSSDCPLPNSAVLASGG